ncbi:hypothetical protein HMPREF9081_0468 [Centipeda periodontii DSM 2778]|uniref:Uncharacterized protein n=1 Tax=Centipeda periodontii DSM 2778 TaxID=888060 RepID=F5RJN3_9FIRM|nr:hypothetical protein HMPREF9081_0468 [Centipeda periodontii DSM 2778]
MVLLQKFRIHFKSPPLLSCAKREQGRALFIVFCYSVSVFA